MNLDIKNIKNFMRGSYDKLALFLTLTGLLVSVGLLLLFLEREQRALEEAAWERPVTHGKSVGELNLHGLYDAIEAVSEPFHKPARPARMMVAAVRAACVQCSRPIPFDAEKCPFVNCGVTQPVAPVEAGDKDSSGDGIPDWWKQQYGMDPLADDSQTDLDGDGFTALEEFRHGTDPTDPLSFPSPLIKLKVLRVGRAPMPLSFQGVQRLTEDDVMFTVRNNATHRDYYVRLGGEVEGYRVVEYEPRSEAVSRGGITFQENISILRLERDGRVVELTLGRGVGQGPRMAQLLFEIDDTRQLVMVGDRIELKGLAYKIVDIRGDGVVISEESSDQETLIAAQ